MFFLLQFSAKNNKAACLFETSYTYDLNKLFSRMFLKNKFCDSLWFWALCKGGDELVALSSK